MECSFHNGYCSSMLNRTQVRLSKSVITIYLLCFKTNIHVYMQYSVCIGLLSNEDSNHWTTHVCSHTDLQYYHPWWDIHSIQLLLQQFEQNSCQTSKICYVDNPLSFVFLYKQGCTIIIASAQVYCLLKIAMIGPHVCSHTDLVHTLIFITYDGMPVPYSYYSIVV